MAGQVRQPIDEAAFGRFLADNVPQIKTPVELKQFSFGQSNPTYQVTAADGQRFVMRKKPPGRLVSKTAHKVEREYRIMRALAGTDVAVPRTYCLCEDEAVIGTPFYLMQFLDGRIIEDPAMGGVAPAERTAMWRAAVETLARLHAVDYRAAGLDDFGRASGFYARQVRTWRAICERQEAVADVDTGEAVGRLTHFERLVDFFADAARQPRERTTLVHGDYKMDNIVFDKTEPRVLGVLDWEMATVGHPLSDVCNLLTQFYTARQPGARGDGGAGDGLLPGRTAGLPTPEQAVEWYVAVSGYDVRAELAWGMAFNVFRLAAVCQGIAARYAVRQASSAKAQSYMAARGPLAEFAWQLAQEAAGQGPRL